MILKNYTLMWLGTAILNDCMICFIDSLLYSAFQLAWLDNYLKKDKYLYKYTCYL